MNFNLFSKHLLTVKRWVATTLLCLFITIFAVQGAFFSDLTAMASTSENLIASGDLGDKIQQKAGKDAGRAESFVQDTAKKVKKTAQKNADKVDQATDDDSNFIGRKAKRDQTRIEDKADKDAARTQKAIDKTKNGVERTIDSIKDAFNG